MSAIPDAIVEQTPEVPVNTPCPRCGKPLIDPSGLGWCSGCGYCKSLANDESKKILEEKKGPSLGGMVEAGGAVSGLPAWFWACFPFAAIGIIFALFMNKRLPVGDNFDRALWATLQIAAGVLMVFLAQVCALVTIAPEEPTLSFKDAMVAGKLWGMVFKRLPRCKECLWFAILGLSLIVGSAVCIGGFQHWFSYLPKSLAQQEIEKAKARSGGGEPVVLPVD